jgi:peptide/nickel transport system permease protein
MLGSDIYARILFGARISLMVSLGAVAIRHGVGALIGISSAYLGGRFDLVVQRIMDALQSFPLLIMAVAIVAFLGPSLVNVILSLAMVIIPSSQRVVRSSALIVREQQYIEAAKVLGAGNGRIMSAHILPNVTAPIIVIASASLGTATLVEASLSFLGLGPPPPTPTWGAMLSAAAAQYMELAPWTAIFPGLAISITVLGFNLLGDAVRDLWDPRLRGR